MQKKNQIISFTSSSKNSFEHDMNFKNLFRIFKSEIYKQASNQSAVRFDSKKK